MGHRHSVRCCGPTIRVCGDLTLAKKRSNVVKKTRKRRHAGRDTKNQVKNKKNGQQKFANANKKGR